MARLKRLVPASAPNGCRVFTMAGTWPDRIWVGADRTEVANRRSRVPDTLVAHEKQDVFMSELGSIVDQPQSIAEMNDPDAQNMDFNDCLNPNSAPAQVKNR
jgi:hypothetical protein